MKKLDPGDNLEVAIIETKIHREEVRQRHVQEDEADHIKYTLPILHFVSTVLLSS